MDGLRLCEESRSSANVNQRKGLFKLVSHDDKLDYFLRAAGVLGRRGGD